MSTSKTLAVIARRSFPRSLIPLLGSLVVLASASDLVQASEETLAGKLKSLPFKIAYETYTNDNWEIFVVNADGSHSVNLTQTPKEQEHYPQVSPDGTKLCFSVDTGEGRETVRSLYVMTVDGRERRKLAENAREPFWSPDSQTIGFLPQEFTKFNVVDFSTTGMHFYDLKTGKVRVHPNSSKLHHLYNPSFAPNGKWIVATVHAGMGVDHGIMLIGADNDKIINLKISGCRPCFSPDGQQLAWGPGDHEIATAGINLDADQPAIGEKRVRITDKKNKVYHVDWSPDSQFLSISRGPDGKGDLSKPGTFQSACEIVGVHAAGWNLYVVSATKLGTLDLNQASPSDYVMLTTNGLSNKESAWFRSASK